MKPDDLAARGVRVKALEWRKSDIWKREQAGEYTVQNEHDRTGFNVWSAWQDGCFMGDYTTLEAAKEAAQADYESRILAALEVSDE